ncbi:MAG: AsmA family protein [Acidocella sp.]|nr:AsmA family protein [Acidocella sp.]
MPSPGHVLRTEHHIGRVILLGVALLFALLIVFWNWDWFRPLAETQASEALGRDVSLQHLRVDLGGTTRITATDVVIADPKGFTGSGDLASIARLTIDINVMAYLHHQRWVLTRILLDHPTLNLRQLGAGQNNYTLHFKKTAGNSKPVQIGTLQIRNGEASMIAAASKTDIRIRIDTRAATNGATRDEITANAKGLYNGQPIAFNFVGGALLSLRNTAQPYPVNFHLSNGATTISLIGTISRPLTLGGADLKLALAGQDVSDLSALSGIPLPATPPYNIDGQLDYTKGTISFHNFKGRIGSSDLEGNITYTAGPAGARPLVTAVLTSRQVNLTDLAGFLGAQPGTTNTPGQDHETIAKVERAEARSKLLPDTPISLPHLTVANFEVRYHGEHIINKNVPLDNVVADLSIENGRITLHPFNFAVGTGTIASDVDLLPVGGVLHTTANITARQLPLARIMAATNGFAGNGIVGGGAHLTATGNSLAAMLGHGNGHMQLFMNHGGNVSALLVDLAGLQMGDAVLSALGVPRQTTIQCLVSDFTLNNGQMKTKAFLLATPEANILGSGTANLTDETLDLALRTEATHFSIGSFSTPIDIGGTLKHPSVLPAAGPLAARALPAIGLGILFPPLALIPTIRLGLGDKNACADTLETLHNHAPHNPK